MSTDTLITAEQFSQMSFDVPVELVRGEIVTMTSRGGVHGKVCSNVSYELEGWARKSGEYEVVGNDPGVQTGSDPDSVRGPELLVIKTERLPGGRIPVGHFTVPPEVAIEVMSPSDRWSKVVSKAGDFLEAGVGEVWVLNPEKRTVQVFLQDGDVSRLLETDILISSLLPGFSCPVRELFRGVAEALR